MPGGSQGVCGGGGGRGAGQKVLPERAEFWASSWLLLVTAQRLDGVRSYQDTELPLFLELSPVTLLSPAIRGVEATARNRKNSVELRQKAACWKVPPGL